MFCPFGYLDGVCHKEPMEFGYCSCPSDLYHCDKELGCVCNDGFDCEGGTHFINFDPLQAQNGSGSHKHAGVIVAVVVILALVVLVLVFLYYRRRMSRMKKDLENRSVRYIENSVLQSSVHINPVNQNGGGYETSVVDPDANNQTNNVMNVRNNVYAAACASTSGSSSAASSTSRPEKNVNIDRFKLGEDEDEDDDEVDCGAEGAAAAAAAAVPTTTTSSPKPPHAAKNVNVFDKDDFDWSPSKEKNNAKLADLNRKIAKANVNSVINNLEERDNLENGRMEEDSGSEEEEDMDPKTLMKKSQNNV